MPHQPSTPSTTTSRRRHRPKRRHLVPLVQLAFSLSVLLFLLVPFACSAVLGRANALGRRCSLPAPPLPVRTSDSGLRIAIVTLSDEGEGGGRGKGRRSFRGVMAAAGESKRAYAARYKYDYVEMGREAVDVGRPPSWSKILAIRGIMAEYDWVFWNDADTLVTNPDIKLEDILIAMIGHSDFHNAPDLLLTEDFNGVNAGVFFMRRSHWSEIFLGIWWNQTSFVQFGSTKSGDNAALKHLIAHLSPEESHEHVRISPMQCLFNSYPWQLTLKSMFRLIFFPSITWKGVYSDGDFLIHFAGLDDKYGWTAKTAREMKLGSRHMLC